MANQSVNIREAFQAREGYYFIDPDYSQIEFRLSAALAGERPLIIGFHEGNDYYKMIFRQMKGGTIALEDVTKSERQLGKTVALGQNYDQGDSGLARKLRCDIEHARDVRESYWAGLPATKAAKEIAVQRALATGQVHTWFGRVRYLPELFSDNRRLRAKGIRSVWNTIIQGTAADWLKIAMVRCYAALKDRDVHILITVHDELVFEASEKESCLEITEIIRQAMEFKVKGLPLGCEDMYPDGYFVPCDFEYGYDWGTLFKLDDWTDKSTPMIGFRTYCANENKPVNFDAPRPENISVSFVAPKNTDPRIEVAPRKNRKAKMSNTGEIQTGGLDPVDAVIVWAKTGKAPEGPPNLAVVAPPIEFVPAQPVADTPQPVAQLRGPPIAAVNPIVAEPGKNYAEEVVKTLGEPGMMKPETNLPKPTPPIAPTNGQSEIAVPSKDDYTYPCLVVRVEKELTSKEAAFLKALFEKFPGKHWVFLEYRDKIVRAGEKLLVDPNQDMLDYLKRGLGERTTHEIFDTPGGTARGKINFV